MKFLLPQYFLLLLLGEGWDEDKKNSIDSSMLLVITYLVLSNYINCILNSNLILIFYGFLLYSESLLLPGNVPKSQTLRIFQLLLSC